MEIIIKLLVGKNREKKEKLKPFYYNEPANKNSKIHERNITGKPMKLMFTPDKIV